MAKVARSKRTEDKRFKNPTHFGIIRKVQQPSRTEVISLTEFTQCWGSTDKVLYRKVDGLERGKALTSIWQLDFDSIKPLGDSNEKV